MNGAPKLAARDLLVVRGGHTILDVPYLDVQRGEVLSVIGPNGAGKSTLLQALALLEKPTAGGVIVDGVPARGVELELRRRMAVVFQQPLLLDTTVEANVALGLSLRGVSRSDKRGRVEVWLERFGVSQLAKRSVRTLSVGEAQRVSLARAFALQPDVLFLDEPFSSLDQPTREALTLDLQEALHETATTTIFVTLNRAEAVQLGSRIAVIMDGRLRQVSTPGEMLASPADEEVAAFLGVETILEGRVLSSEDGVSRLAVGDHHIVVSGAYLPGQELLVCLRPEDISLVAPEDQPALGSPLNLVKGTITKLAPLESQFRVVVECSEPFTVLVRKHSFIGLSLAKGKEVVLAFDPSAVHVIPKQR